MRHLNGIFVDGRWTEGSGQETFTVVNPHSEEPYGEITLADDRDVDVAVRSAEKAAGGEWAATSLEDRIAVVERIAELLAARREELAGINARSAGLLYKSALSMGRALELIPMYIDSVRRVTFEYVRSDAYGHSLISRQPVGVVAGIVPWNAPIRSEVKKTIPALLAGCTVVLKPAPETPFGGAIFAEICREAGVPDGVVNMLPGGAKTGEALVSHPLVRKIAFTGSTAAGARIAAVAAPAFKRLQLELGGKSAAIVLEDADLAATLPIIVGGNWGNSGQACTAITRVLVPRSRHDEVVDGLVAAAGAQRVGDPLDPKSTMGPLVARRQQDRVLSYIESGQAAGAKLAAGGGRPAGLDRGFYIEPTVFTGVTRDMKIAQEEIFGPVTSVISYDDIDEAVAIANDSAYGLHGGVFGRDEERALGIARQIDTGSVAVNNFYLASSAPFGGVKNSGIGREHGPEGFDSFLEYISYNISPELAATLTRQLPEG
jgi:aldehyde dehydrogenase (NAD+)